VVAQLQCQRAIGTPLSSQWWSFPPFCPEEVKQIVESIENSEPVEHEIPGHNWTVKKLRRWVEEKLGKPVSRSALRTLLKQAGLSWKKCKKLLAKANPQKRAQFVEQFQALYERMVQGEVRIIYIDEVHVHQDMDLGYAWTPRGKPAWRKSMSPGLSKRINWYGAYDFSDGRTFIWHEGKCNGANTIHFLQRLSTWLGQSKRQVVIIWDGASYHRSKIVRAAAEKLDFEIVPLPGYSPDLNPIEGLWKWMREEVTQNHCHLTMYQLFLDCIAFIDSINQDPDSIIRRLWPKFDLDPEFEKLLLSN
jgi:transposase